MEEKVYALTYAPAIEGAYAHGPTNDLASLLAEEPDEGIEAEIHIVDEEADPIVVLRWIDGGWKLDEMAPLDEDDLVQVDLASMNARIAVMRSDPFTEPSKIKQIIIDDLNLNGQDTLLVTCRVRAFTVESKARAGEYQNEIRSYVQLEPENLRLHIPVHNAAQLVNDDSGNLDVFGNVLRRIGQRLDMEIVSLAHERVDRQIVERDANVSGVKLTGRRVQTQKEESKPL